MVPSRPKLYHIVHVDRLHSIVADGQLWCDREMSNRAMQATELGTTIGMSGIKRRRLDELRLSCHPELFVGDCVPFYFCPRSVMLYLIHQANAPGLTYRGGQEPILHLEMDLHDVVRWAQGQGLRWAFTLSNAGAQYCEFRCDLGQLSEVDWEAIEARSWQELKEEKQAEFLLERAMPWHLVERIGVRSMQTSSLVANALLSTLGHCPRVVVLPEWYY